MTPRLLSEHLDDMDGELLPHLLFYDITISLGTPGTSGPGRRSQVSELRSSGTSIALRCRASRGTTPTALSCVLASTTGAGTPSS